MSSTTSSTQTGSLQSVPPRSRPIAPGFIDRTARGLFCRKLAGLSGGVLNLSDALGQQVLGAAGAASLSCHVEVHDAGFYRHAILGGSLSVAESYLRGHWDCDDLTAMFRIFCRNMPVTNGIDLGLSRVAQWLARGYHALHANSKQGSRRNIGAHYDLGNDLFQIMLDETLSYSCALFEPPGCSLADASRAKLDRVCRKLDLRPGDHLLEIGTGWGGLAMHAARNFGCHVTTTTISRQQHDLAKERIQQAGLADRITLLLEDYRDLKGQYDKLVSIEMIEAVGHEHFDTYFRQCHNLLRPGGTFVLQGIVMREQRYREYLRSVDFIQRYIFPGGCLPSVGAIVASTGRTPGLFLAHHEELGPHYAQTLRHWRSRFHARLDEVRRLGYSETFVRMWNYYLCYCEAAFEERCIGLVQMQFTKD